MADVAWTQINTNSAPLKTYQAVLDDTNKDTEILPLLPFKETSFAITTTVDTYLVNVEVYLEDLNNASPVAYTFLVGVGEVALLDTVKSAIGPITGIKFVENTATASNSATIQVLQQ